ncbi:unnamed protein product [Didymodactylos carnosus]|uniref:Protein kinase domain-containing protein n=1 Tax=Didymodactylos carnosus TaxID=1234261 RepID=A0A813RGJ6_9BILA|nr:unnamed protein product [Didymodactylos carnosus]CAF0830589.1 unnamed protein product [Didymodactylos carnosus]CAF3564395.1 unnamed protein product [Didymodactylos carnosus]CAF3615069.1 unnamed protein product [Didymodactylos carnosus]
MTQGSPCNTDFFNCIDWTQTRRSGYQIGANEPDAPQYKYRRSGTYSSDGEQTGNKAPTDKRTKSRSVAATDRLKSLKNKANESKLTPFEKNNKNVSDFAIQSATQSGRKSSTSKLKSSLSSPTMSMLGDRTLQSKSREKTSLQQSEEIPVAAWYQVTTGQTLGEGGLYAIHEYFSGKVVKGTYNGRTVAIKIPLRLEDFNEALNEFQKLRNFVHRNVVEAIAYCKTPPMLIMEYMEGGTLYGWLHNGENKTRKINWYQGMSLLLDIAHGVKLLHDSNLLHGDLSSNNVLLTSDHETAKISDFGTVQLVEKYINASLAGQVDEAIDGCHLRDFGITVLTSYGCILMEFLSQPRRIPFYEANTTILMNKLESYTEGDIRDLGIPLDQTSPPELEELMYNCLKAKRTDRPDYGKICDILEPILESIKTSSAYLTSRKTGAKSAKTSSKSTKRMGGHSKGGRGTDQKWK